MAGWLARPGLDIIADVELRLQNLDIYNRHIFTTCIHFGKFALTAI